MRLQQKQCSKSGGASSVEPPILRLPFFAREGSTELAPPNRFRGGFSLIEIMVAVTLLSVIMIGLLAMFYHTQRAFRLGVGQVDTLENGRATLQLLARELQEMYPSHVDHVLSFDVAPVNAPEQIVMDLPGNVKRTNVLQNISFLMRRGDEWVGIAYRIDHGGRGAGSLHRFIAATNPLAAYRQATPMGRVHAVAVSNVMQAALQPVNFASPSVYRVADGIVHLRLYAYDQNGIPYGVNNNNNIVPDRYRFTNAVPAYLDIELGVLDPKATTQMNGKPNVLLARQYLRDQGHRMQVFRQRIPIRARRAQFDWFAAPPPPP